MKSLFDNPRAFAPFYDDRIAVEGKRGSRTLKTGQLPANLIDKSLEEPVSDNSTSTTVYRYRFLIDKDVWPELEDPRIGDVLTLSDGTRLSFKDSGEENGNFYLEARTC